MCKLETYYDSGVPFKHQLAILLMAKDLIEFEQSLSVEITGHRRQVSSADSLEQFLVKESLITLALDEKDSVLGFCTYWFEPVLGRLVIDTIFVSPAHRKKGIAKKLLSVPLQTKCSFIDISVMVNNEAAMGLYKSLGFKAYITTMTLAK